MSSLKLLNQDAEHAKRFVALAMNINAAKGLQEVLKTNLGPKVSKCSKRVRANRAVSGHAHEGRCWAAAAEARCGARGALAASVGICRAAACTTGARGRKHHSARADRAVKMLGLVEHL